VAQSSDLPIPESGVRLHAERLARTLRERETKQAQIDGFARSAVLIPVLRGEHEDFVLFTQRTERVEHHKGQISFPGGRLDPGESLIDCALREAREEVGIDPAAVQVLGALDETWTPTRYVISPFVGLLPRPPRFETSADEIERLLVLPLRRLLNPDRYDENEMTHLGRSAAVPFYYIDELIIWGATARMLRQFLHLAFDHR
jgi:8-oxo-dGTP pyrophosphatase MutT (NUDIX family)